MNLGCLLGCHSYKKISHSIPIKCDGEFDEFVYGGHYALGKCSVCGELSMQKCCGRYTYLPSEMLTKKEGMELLVVGQFE